MERRGFLKVLAALPLFARHKPAIPASNVSGIAEMARRALIRDAGVLPRCVPDVANRLLIRFEASVGQPMRIEEWLSEMRDECPHLFDPRRS